VNQPRTQRIHRGFHRVGAVLAGIVLAVGLSLVVVIAVEDAQRNNTDNSASISKSPNYTLPQLETALENADKAGDAAAARRLAEEIRKIRATLSDTSISVVKDILESPEFVNGDKETRQRIFYKHVATNPAYINANGATQDAIRERYGIEDVFDQLDKPKGADDPIVEQRSEGRLNHLATVINNLSFWLLAGFAAAAAAIYILCRGVGWIIAGFVGY
jgi:hypothetical protein